MQPILTGSRVVLRPWRVGDVDAVTAACQDPEIQRWTRVPVPYRRQDAETFVRDMSAETYAEGGALFAVTDAGDGSLVGSIGLFAPKDGVGEIGYWTAPGHRRRGLTAEALRVLADWALDELRLRRVELVVDARNTGSRRVGEAAGFSVEGTLRQRTVHRGEPVDDVVLGLLATDPRPKG